MRRFLLCSCLLFVLMGLTFLPLTIDFLHDKEEIESTKQLQLTTPSTVDAKADVEAIQLEITYDTNETTPNIPVLMYHILLKNRNDVISIDPLRFKEHMSSIKQAGYSTITDYELADHLKNNTRLPKKPILITFDDGYKSVYTEAFPILEELGMKATINVIASRIYENVNTLHPDEYEKITWPEARLMQGTMIIQSHTLDSHHKKRNEQNELQGVITGRMANESGVETQRDFERRVLDDLLLSKNIIEEKMGYDVVSLAYPYGEYSIDTIQLAQMAGYEMAFTVKSGLVNRTTDAHFELDRITANGAYSGDQLIAVIEAAQ